MANDLTWDDKDYQVLSELGHNSLGGRVTYLAQRTEDRQRVVIKQFQFAQGADWSAYDAYEREIRLLQRLNHPGIPKYLDGFQTPSGFCMVQEYLQAQSLAMLRRWTPEKIKQVALSLLDILVYLQSQSPPIIHRDIKPENILLDARDKVYLVDFGFARLGDGTVAASSVVKGTMGFMPPEQLFNRQLTTASDLYGLGATLICLLTGTSSSALGNLVDERYCLQFQHLVPPLKRGWLSWLAKLVEPIPKDRYASAAEALAALQPIDVNRLPKLRLSDDQLDWVGSRWGETLQHRLALSNPIPETVLAGRWEVTPHPSDPPHTPYDHAWISFEPQQFKGNAVDCRIAIDTGQLMAGQTYEREVVLRTNAAPDRAVIPVRVQTAPLPERRPFVDWMLLGWFGWFVWPAGLPAIDAALALFASSWDWFVPVGTSFFWGCLAGLPAADRLVAFSVFGKTASRRSVAIIALLSLTLAIFVGEILSFSPFWLPFVFASAMLAISLMRAEVFVSPEVPRRSKYCHFAIYLAIIFLLILASDYLRLVLSGEFGQLHMSLTGLQKLLFLLGFFLVILLFSRFFEAMAKRRVDRGFSECETMTTLRIIAAFGISISCFFLSPLVWNLRMLLVKPMFFEVAILIFAAIAPVILFSVLLVKRCISPALSNAKKIRNYHQFESQLIQP